jgi:hypothetical protein
MSRIFSLRFLSLGLLAASLSLFAMGCESDSGDDGAGSVLTGGAKDSAKPYAVEVEASGDDGTAPASIKGDADAALPGMYVADFAMGELVVYLQGSDMSTIFFTVDTNQASVPGDVAMGNSLDSAGFLVYTTPMGMIYESTGGTLNLDTCPDGMGAVVTGSLDKVVVTSVAADIGMGGTMNLSGTFKVTVATHDGSERCVAAPQPESTDNPEVVQDVEQSGPPGCSVVGCDGPCCPYGPCMSSCLFTCMQEKCMNPATMMECMNCDPDCLEECNVDQACISKLEIVAQCAADNECEPGPMEESPCLGAHCCSEYDAAF